MDQVKFFALACLLGLLSSCHENGRYRQEMSTVDSLQHRVQHYSAMMDSLDVNEVRQSLQKVDERLKALSESNVPKENKEFWVEDVGELATIRKSLNRYLENHQKIEEKIEFTGHQLATLQNSLSDEKVSTEQAEEYLSSESKATAQIKFDVMKTYLQARRAFDLWREKEDYYDSLAQELPAHP